MPFTKADGSALAAGDLPAGADFLSEYDPTGPRHRVLGQRPSDTLALIAANPSVVTAISQTVYAKGSLIRQFWILANGTYVPSANAREIDVECVGGGAAGGPAGPTGSGQFGSGGGGGPGGYTKSTYTVDATMRAGVPCTIGAGGTSIVSQAYYAGQTGATTYFGAYQSAPGGIGGGPGGAASAPAVQAGGAGGVGANGGVENRAGQAGGIAVSFSGGNEAAGAGGPSPFGSAGGQPVFTGNFNGNAPSAGSYGAGGSGAVSQGSNANGQVGGSGLQGAIRITERA